MAYRASRKHRKVGAPEFWLVCLVVFTIAPATVWWTQQYQPKWEKTGGTITSWEVSGMHYNAQDYRIKAKVQYEYLVGLAKYSGHFEGFWPEVGNPNALTPEEVETATKVGKSLVIYYDPANPAHSQPFAEKTGPALTWVVLSAAGLVCTLFYTFVVYPHRRA